MRFTETKLKGAWIFDIEKREDTRGFFARTFCLREFEAHGIKVGVSQCNLSFNFRKGTVRGMHFQHPPATETKLVRCVAGAICDVIIDLRPGSPTYAQHIAVELTAENRRTLFVPEMFAHGYQSLTDNAEVNYITGGFYSPQHEGGVRHDDPAFGIVWPLPISEISPKDTAWPLLKTGAQA